MHESQWEAIVSTAAKFGCSAETLRKWVRQHERDSGQREETRTAKQQRIKDLEEREVRQPRQANEILRKVRVYFAQAAASSRPFKR